MNHKILLIEDEKPIADLLQYGLEKEGFEVFAAYTGEDGLKAVDTVYPQVILLDLMLPDMDGLDILKAISLERSIPVLIVSAKNDQVDKLIGLEYGADDYITKPFDIREVILRIKSILRRVAMSKDSQEKGDVLQAGDLVLHCGKHEVTKGAERIELTPKEFKLLETLLRNRGKVLTRAELLEQVWQFEYVGDTRTVDIHIQRLRRKLKDDTFIVTVFGLGYKILEEEP